jgi:hypothetical protein
MYREETLLKFSVYLCESSVFSVACIVIVLVEIEKRS